MRAGGSRTKEARRRLSLSDSYWVKYDNDNVDFEAITPYLNPFSELLMQHGHRRSNSIPEIVLGGSQPKKWVRDKDKSLYIEKILLPEQVEVEMRAVRLARLCNVKVMNAFVKTSKGRVYADNFTKLKEQIGVINLVNISNLNRSLIQFDYLGIGVNGYDIKNVVEAYKRAGVERDVGQITLTQIVFDTVVGNIDRKSNNSNWAVFLDHGTGERIPSSMYDFNWASTKYSDEKMIKEVAVGIKSARMEEEAKILTETIGENSRALKFTQWAENAAKLVALLKS